MIERSWRTCARVATASAVLCALVALGGLAGCGPSGSVGRAQPQLAPPAIKQAGVLRAGVDLSYPPFGGIEQGDKAGIDVEVASALAGRLGLDLKLVDVKASQVATALAEGKVDVALSAPFSADVITRASIAGTYLSDGPALFAGDTLPAATTTDSAMAADATVIGAQQGSEAYWLAVADRGVDGVKTYPTLRDAFDALDGHEVQAVAGDALVGGYIARDRPGVRYAGLLGQSHLLGVAVPAQDGKLSDGVRTTLDRLVSDGALDAIRRAWVGQLPKLPLPSIQDAETSSSVLATP